MVISGSQHPLKVDYRIPKDIIQLLVNKILVVVVVVVVCSRVVKSSCENFFLQLLRWILLP